VVRHKLGFALYQAQIGRKHESAKMLHGLAEKVWQVRADDPGGTMAILLSDTLEPSTAGFAELISGNGDISIARRYNTEEERTWF
jgi:hypothetical protein